MKLDFDLNRPDAPVVLRPVKAGYERKSADEFNDEAASLTPRQVLFYQNLMQLASGLKSNLLPVDFETPSQGRLYLDRGCIMIAVHAGYLRPLTNDADGKVSSIELAWDATGERKV